MYSGGSLLPGTVMGPGTTLLPLGGKCNRYTTSPSLSRTRRGPTQGLSSFGHLPFVLLGLKTQTSSPAWKCLPLLFFIRQHQPAVQIEHGMPPNLSYQNTWPSLRPQRRPEHERPHVCLYPKLSEWVLRHLCVSRSPGSSFYGVAWLSNRHSD